MSLQTPDTSNYWTQLPPNTLAMRERRRPVNIAVPDGSLVRRHRTQKGATTMDMPTSSPQTPAQTLSESLGLPAVPVPRKLLVWLTVGVSGTLLFLVIYLIEGATRPGYNAWAQTISSLSFGPGGWIQRANFILCGVSALWLAVVWRQILKGGVCARWYPIVRGVEGLGLIGVG